MIQKIEPWGFEIEHCRWLWFGRRLRVIATLVNRSPVASIPDARRMRPTLRDVHGHALAVSEVYRPGDGPLTVFRPVVQPAASIQVCFQFERLPDDRNPATLALGGTIHLLPILDAPPLRRRRGAVGHGL